MLPTSMAHQASACTFHFTYHISSTVVARPTSHRMYDFLLREGLRVLDQGRRAIVLDRPEHIWHTYAITVHGESGWYRPLDSANQWLEMMLELPFKIGTLYRKYRFRKVWLRINLELQLFWKQRGVGDWNIMSLFCIRKKILGPVWSVRLVVVTENGITKCGEVQLEKNYNT
jgi:hypothetical protein